MPVHDPNFAALPQPPASRWSRTFWADLAERVGVTAIGALLAVVTGSTTGALPNDPAVWWAVIGVPVVASLLKGLAANLASPASGPSLLPAPPAPVVEPAPVEPAPVVDQPNPPAVVAKKAPAKKAAAKRPAKKAAPRTPKGLS